MQCYGWDNKGENCNQEKVIVKLAVYPCDASKHTKGNLSGRKKVKFVRMPDSEKSILKSEFRLASQRVSHTNNLKI